MESTSLINTHPHKSNMVIEPESCFKSNQYLEIRCYICGQYIVHARTTQCHHSFCEICIEEYMIFLDQCPLCHGVTRNTKIFSNRVLDQLIEGYIQKYDETILKDYYERRENSKVYKQNRRLAASQLIKGALMDVRDSNYVWGPGKVLSNFFISLTPTHNLSMVTIKYENRALIEEIDVNSERFAPLGFFSRRLDLPRIRRNKWLWLGSQIDMTYTLQEEINIPRK